MHQDGVSRVVCVGEPVTFHSGISTHATDIYDSVGFRPTVCG